MLRHLAQVWLAEAKSPTSVVPPPAPIYWFPCAGFAMVSAYRDCWFAVVEHSCPAAYVEALNVNTEAGPVFAIGSQPAPLAPHTPGMYTALLSGKPMGAWL